MKNHSKLDADHHAWKLVVQTQLQMSEKSLDATKVHSRLLPEKKTPKADLSPHMDAVWEVTTEAHEEEAVGRGVVKWEGQIVVKVVRKEKPSTWDELRLVALARPSGKHLAK